MNHEHPQNADPAYWQAIRNDFDNREAEMSGPQRIMGRRLDPLACIPASENYVREALEHVGDAFDGKDVLEVGSGIGRFTPHLAARAHTVVALDFSQRMASATRGEVVEAGAENAHVLQASAVELPVATDSVDAVFASEVYFHVTHADDFTKAMNELRRVLRPGGFAFISEALSDGNEGRQLHDFLRFHSMSEYQKALAPLTIGTIATSKVIDQVNTMFFAR